MELTLNNSRIKARTKHDIRYVVINNIKYKPKIIKHQTIDEHEFTNNIIKFEKFIRDNNILFTFADKGVVTVAIERKEYIRKMYD